MIVPHSCPSCGHKMDAEITKTEHGAGCPKCAHVSRVQFDWIQPGMIVGNGYRIVRELEPGKRCKLFLAIQETMNREVELKVLSPEVAGDEEEFQRFQREIKLAATISHPTVLAAYGAGTDCGLHFLIRQFKKGENLEVYCNRCGQMSEEDAFKRMLPIAEALKFAWEKHQILHRNLRPENILLCEDGMTMLADLAVAKSMAKNSVDITMDGFTVGTPEFMSPEQVRGEMKLDCRSDIYGFCVVLYRLLTGKLPFTEKSSLMVMQQQLNDDPVPVIALNSGVSKRCSDLIVRGLEKGREDRYQDWGEVILEMKGVLRGESSTKKQARAVRKQSSVRGSEARSAGKRRAAKSVGRADGTSGISGLLVLGAIMLVAVVVAIFLFIW